MARTTMLLGACSALAITLLSPAACTPTATARPAVEAPREKKGDDSKANEKAKQKERDAIRSVKRHSSEFDRKKQQVKPDRPVGPDGQPAIIEIDDPALAPPAPPSDPIALDSAVFEPVKFWVWTGVLHQDLDVSDDYWLNENVHPLVHPLVNVPFYGGFNAPGFPVPQRRFGADGNPLPVDPQASAQQTFGYIAWHKQALLERGRTNFQYAIWPQNWGTRNEQNPEENLANVFALGGNPTDKLTQPGIGDHAEYESFYAAHGINMNKFWSEDYVGHLDALLGTAGIAPPTALFFDLEAAFTNRKAMRWWTAALEDPRAQTERVDGIHTMAELEAMAPDYDPNQEIWRPVNREMYTFTHSMSQRVLEYALWEGFWKQAREVWPDVLLSNYHLHGAAPGKTVPVARLNATVKGAELRYADFASPILYGFPSYAINAADTLNEHLMRYGGTPSGNVAQDRCDLVIRFHKARMNALAESGTAMAPWISTPEFAGLTTEQTIEVMNYGTDLGVRNWLFWSADPYDWTEIVDAVTEYAEQSAAGGVIQD